ncbi:toll/interleukin-1 receptor domain-containing protein [Fodinibius halophilus]|uniref:Toll/interleukin-1 receptor domain-containing protein n=1 Tax=Fodinibius halophilus TaxID=1736908 RepID=A0A6M1T0S3_9BACT|nr:toll/interleukin-1 receptor domain-containing protein [Fodinibius halophilus]NGP89688.1 toll/interleukin-1 receptor domain-containing protein [Fodinibius halophilus]
MNKLEKRELISIIGRELQERMTFTDIDAYFTEYGIPTDHEPSANSKWVYVKEVLAGVDDDIVLQIASELDIKHKALSETPIIEEDEATFWKPGHFRLFLSHLSSFKVTVTRLKRALEPYGISSFVAHEDIEPTKLWEKEIEKGLFSMDALCAILMPGFKESNWTDQEIGAAIGRGVLVIPDRKNMDPYGFIGKFQGFQANNKTIGEVAEGIFQILSSHDKTRSQLTNKLSDLFLMSNNSEAALNRIKAISKIDDFPEEKVEALHSGITDNKNLQDTDLLKAFNKFMDNFGKPSVAMADFEEKESEEWEDDLPF